MPSIRTKTRSSWLAGFTIAYNLLEGLVSVYFGAQDEALTLFGFGVDSFIEVNRQRFPKATFEVRDISADGIAHPSDFAVLCQVFNNKYDHADNAKVVRSSLEKAFASVRCGLSVDLRTAWLALLPITMKLPMVALDCTPK